MNTCEPGAAKVGGAKQKQIYLKEITITRKLFPTRIKLRIVILLFIQFICFGKLNVWCKLLYIYMYKR